MRQFQEEIIDNILPIKKAPVLAGAFISSLL
jgi:hypothetical protein